MAYIFSALALGMAAGTSNYFLAAAGTVVVIVVAFVLFKTNFGAIYKSEFILRFRFTRLAIARNISKPLTHPVSGLIFCIWNRPVTTKV
ncbi:MAG: hypothetical protein CM1200mP18_14570 [Gammaproteobacteria bacterium]|nr:MAG: hypothetical protein CM1200mP18_14570 [Gammaproteobacteria bacterium]